MPQPITPIDTHSQIHGVRIDVDGERIVIEHSRGTQPEGEAYQAHRQLSDTIEGPAFAALCNTVVTVTSPQQTYQTTVYALLKDLLYGALPI
ncbi:hypothetical protein D3C87_1585860 [compost metagenome]